MFCIWNDVRTTCCSSQTKYKLKKLIWCTTGFKSTTTLLPLSKGTCQYLYQSIQNQTPVSVKYYAKLDAK